ncbi:MAG: helicase HerA domain-containing protein [Candidatus Bathyarchaeia archaeon]
MRPQEKLESLGVIVSGQGMPNHLEFCFQLGKNETRVGEFVEVLAEARVLIARVYRIESYDAYYTDPEFIQDHIRRGIPIAARLPTAHARWRRVRAKIFGVFNTKDGRFTPPEIPSEPGEEVFPASESILRKLLGIKVGGVYIGLLRGKALKIELDTEKLARHHIAVLGATGSGKSYLNAVLAEELLEKKYPVVVIDPHGEHTTFNRPAEGNPDERFGIELCGYPQKIYYPKPVNPGKDYEISLRLSELTAEELGEMTGATDNQINLLYMAIRDVRTKFGENYDLNQLLSVMAESAKTWKFAARTESSTARRILILDELGILGEGIDPKELAKPGHVTIIDLSGDISEIVRRITAAQLVYKLFQARKTGEIAPTFLIVEEAHRFAPQEGEAYSKVVLRKIAREGRKFGLGLCITSQRAIGLDKDVLSQCGTKIILRIDNKSDLDWIRPFLEFATPEDIARIPTLPIGIALTTGVTTRQPIVTEVRPRKTRHGS